MNETATVKIFLVRGSPTSIRTAEISDWTGKAVAGPRSQIEEILKREEAAKPGVYFLAGVNPESGRDRVYIGEAEVIRNRIKGHMNRDFWKTLVFFVSKDENLTKAHIKFLEGRLIDAARDVGRFELENSQASGARLPESDEADMGEFLHRMEQLLPILGQEFLKPVVRADTRTSKVGPAVLRNQGDQGDREADGERVRRTPRVRGGAGRATFHTEVPVRREPARRVEVRGCCPGRPRPARVSFGSRVLQPQCRRRSGPWRTGERADRLEGFEWTLVEAEGGERRPDDPCRRSGHRRSACMIVYPGCMDRHEGPASPARASPGMGYYRRMDLPAPIASRQREIEELCHRHGVLRLEVFGSAADGTFGPRSSDIDFLVEFVALAPGTRADAYFGLLEDLERLLGRPVDLVMTRAVRNRYFLERIESSRVVFYAA